MIQRLDLQKIIEKITTDLVLLGETVKSTIIDSGNKRYNEKNLENIASVKGKKVMFVIETSSKIYKLEIYKKAIFNLINF